MAKFKRISDLLAMFAVLPLGASRYKTARALRFVYRNRRAHRRIIVSLTKAQKNREGSRIRSHGSHAYA